MANYYINFLLYKFFGTYFRILTPVFFVCSFFTVDLFVQNYLYFFLALIPVIPVTRFLAVVQRFTSIQFLLVNLQILVTVRNVTL
jgi:hypothetical protein